MPAMTRSMRDGRRTLTSIAAVAASGVAMLGLGSSANAAIIIYGATLTGLDESPPNASPGTGFAQVTIDTVAHIMRVEASFSGLTGITTAAHIHSATAAPFSGTAAVATTVPSFPGFPLGVTSGLMDQTYDMTLSSSYNPTFITAHGGTTASAEAFLFASFADGTSYFNIHTSTFGGGEIRGFLAPIPAPGGLALLGVAAIGGRRRRRE